MQAMNSGQIWPRALRIVALLSAGTSAPEDQRYREKLLKAAGSFVVKRARYHESGVLQTLNLLLNIS